MPVLPEKREAGGFVREGAFYNGFAGCVPAKFHPAGMRKGPFYKSFAGSGPTGFGRHDVIRNGHDRSENAAPVSRAPRVFASVLV